MLLVATVALLPLRNRIYSLWHLADHFTPNCKKVSRYTMTSDNQVLIAWIYTNNNDLVFLNMWNYSLLHTRIKISSATKLLLISCIRASLLDLSNLQLKLVNNTLLLKFTNMWFMLIHAVSNIILLFTIYLHKK